MNTQRILRHPLGRSHCVHHHRRHHCPHHRRQRRGLRLRPVRARLHGRVRRRALRAEHARAPGTPGAPGLPGHARRDEGPPADVRLLLPGRTYGMALRNCGRRRSAAGGGGGERRDEREQRRGRIRGYADGREDERRSDYDDGRGSFNIEGCNVPGWGSRRFACRQEGIVARRRAKEILLHEPVRSDRPPRRPVRGGPGRRPRPARPGVLGPFDHDGAAAAGPGSGRVQGPHGGVRPVRRRRPGHGAHGHGQERRTGRGFRDVLVLRGGVLGAGRVDDVRDRPRRAGELADDEGVRATVDGTERLRQAVPGGLHAPRFSEEAGKVRLGSLQGQKRKGHLSGSDRRQRRVDYGHVRRSLFAV
mmetsp:Transcript_27334/g.50704  ORF Transcript_27334/g.50704 Transcript_27334/m.50704 type:complete len:361 (+) Transcript_27334:131-1213(+)